VTVSDVHPGAEVLLALPRTELATTARVLLERDGDVMSAAQRLHVHRTTLYYRLERIEALTGVNLRSGVARNDLRMALRLAAYRQAAEFDRPD
jgi:DNA-binding PucR family transcriptional regulator